MQNTRRNFLKTSLSGIGVAVAASPISIAIADGIQSACGLTPRQTSGPFYPGESQFAADNDLVQIPGRPPAQGRIVIIEGQVLDPDCRPIENANVEIWQAAASGRYNNPKDPNPAPLDPHFKYWGETFTDSEGRYTFRTIIPGAYPADANWDRPPHIHFRVARLGYRELVTQMYFEGEPLNATDLILQQTPAGEREKLIVSFQKGISGEAEGRFDITLQPISRG